jgi:ArsR family transcriptional regulator
MNLEELTQILKALGDETRLRILNLLSKRPFMVKELCSILNKPQPLVSKHLMRLKLLDIVGAKRQGFFVYYFLSKTNDKVKNNLVKSLLSYFEFIEILRQDLAMFNAKQRMQKDAKNITLDEWLEAEKK